MATFNAYTGAGDTTLVNALLAPSSGITILSSSITLQASGQTAVNYYDGSLAGLGIGSGLLLTSGTTPGTSNTVGWFGTDNSTTVFNNGDVDVNAVVNTVFQTQSYDATTLEFDFTADATATSVSFDLVFGSDEYPEWVDQFVDCAVVMVNGVNYAYFNHDPLAPLSVVSSNLAAGYFQDNAGNVLPIEYDGVSHVLKIVAPINAGQVNHIKIGIADTGDHIYDSGIFIANFSAGNIPGSGVVSQTSGTTGDDTLLGSSKAEYFDLQSGSDTVYAGAGDDIVVAGSGNDVVYGGTGADKMEGDVGDDYLDGGADADTAVFSGNFNEYQIGLAGANTTLTSNVEGTDTLVSVEFVQFKDGLYALNGNVLTAVDTTTPVANSAGVAAISGIAMAGKTLTAITTDADGIASSATISYLWQTSVDGSTWEDTNVTTKTYLLSSADIGKQVQVIATYSDAAGNLEAPVSSAVTIAQATSGFTIDPMVISAPAGASVMDPLTTLIKNAVDFGYTPNEASFAVKSVFGIASSINLATYDAYAVLSLNPTDATAVAFMKVAAQVAMTASVSDPSGMNMMLAVMNAAAAGTTLNLVNTIDLAAVGVDPTVDPATGKSPLSVIQNLNKNMAEDAHDLAGIEIVWNDWAGKTDAVEQEFLGHLEKISVHINQAPTGGAAAILANGMEGADYTISAGDLLLGFSDPEGDTLSVSGLNADNGFVTCNVDGTFTISFPANYTGPVELTYEVMDGQGGSTMASQMFVIEPNQVTPVNTAPTGAATAALPAGTEDTAYTVSASDLLAGFSDADGDTLSIAGAVTANHGVVSYDSATDTCTVTPDGNYNGTVVLNYSVTDSNGGTVSASQSFTLAAVNDAVTGNATAVLAHGAEDLAYTVTGAQLLQGFDDADVATNGQSLRIAGAVMANHGAVSYDSATDTYTVTPDADYSGAVVLNYSVTDGNGSTVAASQSFTLEAVNDAPITSAVTLGAIVQDSGARLITQSQLLANASDVDGPSLSATGLTIVSGSGTLADNHNGTWSYTPALNDSSSVSFSYSVTDGSLNAPGSAMLDITPLAGVTRTGTAKADVLNGTAQDDTLSGLGGNDTLNGGGGNDTMAGGAGNDTYGVDSTGDVVIEAAGEGADLVQALVSYTLGANVENLTLTGIAAINGTGNALANTLTGNSGNNVLDGGAGSDKMIGGAGDDTYFVDNAGDTVTEGVGAGNDTVVSTLAAYALGTNVENLTLAGVAAINGTGNTVANTLTGNDAANVLSGLAGNDVLNGGAGNDTLIAGAGNDILTGGLGSDVFRFDNTALSATTNVDTVLDFTHGVDAMQLENAVFKKLAVTGTLSAANFHASNDATPLDANDYIQYNATTGALYYDADGSGAGAAIQFATLVGAPAVTAADFFVI